jgi:DNA mismatch repair protein MutS
MNNIKNLFKNKNKEKIDNIQECVLSENEKKEIINKIISYDKTNKLSEEILYDIELFKGTYGNYKDSIISKIDRTHTIMGINNLENILSNPLKNIDKLNERQNIIKKILSSEDFDKINNYLQEIKKNENNILWLWKNNDKEVDNFLESVYFQNRFLKKLNDNPQFLNFFNYYKIIIAPLMGVLYPVVAILVPYLIVRFIFKLPIKFSSYYKLISSSIGGSIFPMASNSNVFKMSKYLSSFLYLFFYIHNTYFSITHSINTNRIINIIHRKMNSIYKILRLSKEISILLKDTVKFDIDLFSESINLEIFKQEPSLFSNKGLILSEYKKIKENKNKIIPIIEYIGLIDSYFSIAKLYNENKNSDFYSLTNFIESENPKIEIQNVWHPYLDKGEVVRNNIIIGGKEKQNIIITGPNAGGKSTFIKSVIISVLFSQTLTISPCEKISITPFELVSTYLNIPDCKGKESLFEAEMNRSLSYINKLKNLEKNNKFSIVVMDEIFNSTNPEEGISGAYAICKKIANFKNNISIITTHFNYLTNLKKYNFENYKIQVDKEGNNIIYPYKLQRGISTQFIALDLLKLRGFDNEIIEESQKVYKKIKGKKINKKIKIKEKKK